MHLHRMRYKHQTGEAQISKPETCHALRHHFSTHLLELGADTLEELFVHSDAKTTIVYTHVLN